MFLFYVFLTMYFQTIIIYCDGVDFLFLCNLQDLGAASQTKRPTSIVLVKSHDDIQDSFGECLSDIKSLPIPL